MRRILPAILCTAGACGVSGATPPVQPDAAPASDNFSWSVELAALTPAILSVATSGGEILAAGGTTDTAVIFDWDGSAPTWRSPLLPDEARALWWAWLAPDSSDALAVGDDATLLRRRDGLWRNEQISGLVDARVSFYGVWGASGDDLWVVGGSLSPGVQPAAILHWDGLEWTAVDPAGLPVQPLFKVWGASANDVWAVGYRGVILHNDGSGWTTADSGTSERLVSLYGRAADDLYAVGGDSGGVILHYDGGAWSAFATTEQPLAGVWTAPGRPLYVAGANAFLARYSDGNATPTTATPETGVDFHSMAGDATRVLAVGADLLGRGTGSSRSGTLVALGVATPMTVTQDPPLDAGPPIDAPVDAAPSAPGLGEVCTGICAGGGSCTFIVNSETAICTLPCTTAASCGAFGANACCHIPGPQTLQPVCEPASYSDCVLPDATP